MTAPRIDTDTLRRLPKAVLHDHLDGGLRPATVVELADAVGHKLPTTDPGEL
ncbi:adenosine deaminase, partial [Streptomyces sp. MBT97]|nr:adenosine deaminase [Streptomyces sp. MBT97]